MKKLLFLFTASLLLGACGKQTKDNITLDITFKSDGPFFESSPESLQHQLTDELASFMKQHHATEANIEAVKLISASFTTSDSTGFGDFSSLTLNMMAGGDSKAKEIAVQNPLAKEASFSAQPAGDADLSEHFKSKEKFLVCDLTPKKDRDTPFELKAKLTFEFTLKD
ncbi:MAG: hypothetical protein ACK5CL_03300 [Sphingomonadales bacterium]|jgi:hypothetical protein